jgi:hypothetical protein
MPPPIRAGQAIIPGQIARATDLAELVVAL